MTPLLTIIVPTYNRADCLALLLQTLRTELAGLESRVHVIVGDNASSDRTAEVTQSFAADFPWVTVLRHERNVGPEENFCLCIERAASRFFWLIGDDDLPRAGAVRALLELLELDDPDLVYLGSDWRGELHDNAPHDPVTRLHALALDRASFARRVHVWTTFISGMVVNRERFLAIQGAGALRRFTGTSLVQLGWVMTLLKSGSRFLVVPQPCVLATAGNSGGYAVFRVFGANFARICADMFGRDDALTRAMVRRNLVTYMPKMVWNVRFSGGGAFEKEDSVEALRREVGHYASFRWLVLPVITLPRPLARLFVRVASKLAKLLLWSDRLRQREATAAVARTAAAAVAAKGASQ